MFEPTQLISQDCPNDARQLLDDVSAALDAREPWAVRELIGGLHTLSQGAPRETFEAQIVPVCRAHPLYERFAADPLVRRCRERPRGYAGDAVMLDYMYEGLPEQEHRVISEEGQALFADIAQGAVATHAVRERRTILARMIDAVASRVARPRVLSIACGHLREAGQSRAVEQGRVSELVALDQDAESLREIERAAYGRCIKPVHASAGAVLKERVELGSFDLIYSAGLYDYLDEQLARALTARLFSMLNPAGRLLIGNFAQGLRDGAFMEAFMDWRLVLRTPARLRGLFADVPSAELALRVCADSLHNVLYADATRCHR